MNLYISHVPKKRRVTPYITKAPCPLCKKLIQKDNLIKHRNRYHRYPFKCKPIEVCFCGCAKGNHNGYNVKVNCIYAKQCGCTNYSYHHTEARPHSVLTFIMPVSRIK